MEGGIRDGSITMIVRAFLEGGVGGQVTKASSRIPILSADTSGSCREFVRCVQAVLALSDGRTSVRLARC